MEHKRSLFWPLFLIAAGVVWLLIQTGTIPSENLWALTHIWPFLLIAAGLGIILRSFWKYAWVLLDVIIIGGVVLAIYYAPLMGWANPPLSFINGISIGPMERGSGEIITETRDLKDFSAIEISYPAEVLVKQGSKPSIKIEADKNLLPGLKTQVRGKVLEISYEKQNGRYVRPTRMVEITVTVKDLDRVDFTSAGELTIEELETDTLRVSMSGAGNLKLDEIQISTLEVNLSGAGSMNASGTADDLDLTITGFGGFQGRRLHSKDAHVSISGAGNATVWVDDDLTAEISGAGSVDYYGSPTVSKRISGVGGVHHQGDQ